MCLYLIVCLLCGARGQLVYVCLGRRQVCRQIPHLHGTVLTARHYKGRFQPGHKHTRRWKIIPQIPPFFFKHLPPNSLSVLVHVIRKTCVTAGVLPGAADGAHSISVAGALGHTVHLTTVAVHLPHTHWPVLKTQQTDINLNVLKQSLCRTADGLRFMICMH